MITNIKIKKQFKKGCVKKRRLEPIHCIRDTTMVHNPPKVMEVKNPLTTTNIKLTVPSRVNPSNWKCIMKPDDSIGM